MIRKNHLILSVMTSMMIGMLGVFSSSFQSIADKIAVTFGQESTMVGLLLSVYASGSFTSVLITSTIADRIGKKKGAQRSYSIRHFRYNACFNVFLLSPDSSGSVPYGHGIWTNGGNG